jgi:peptidoglycan hydrolase-like protein with peptidoglycan-binding domain
VVSAYRTLSKQWELWNLYRSGRGNLAAYPGTSNHGWGLAVDLTPTWSRWAVDQVGRTYGWSKACSDAQSEWWHIKFNPGCTGASWHAGPSGPRVLREGMSGNDVGEVQIYLLRGGYLRKGDPKHHIPPAIDNHFGPGTKAAVQKFQRDNHLTADGVVGPTTIGLLRRKYKAK